LYFAQVKNTIALKNTIAYYIVIASPVAILAILAKNKEIASDWFVTSMLLYCFVYRPITDYYRLLSKGLLSKRDFWRAFTPFLQAKYFKALYWP
jgi:hypothetical protein